MIDVHLIGYTADLDHLVFDLDGESNGRYRLVVDADLLATLLEIRERSQEIGKAWPGDELVTWDEDDWDEEEWDEDESEDDDVDEDDGFEDDEPGDDEPGDDEPEDDEPGDDVEPEDDEPEDDEPGDDEPGDDVEPAPVAPARAAPPRPSVPARTPRPAPRPEPEPEPEPARTPEPRVQATLSPAQIQSMLRAGRTPSAVAKAAGTDVAWIERWLAPILEERARVLREARARKLSRPRLGASRAPLGDAVDRALADRNVPAEEIDWEVSRRNDGRWRVSVRFRHRNRARTASWTYDPRDGQIEASSDLARDLGFRAPRGSAGTTRTARTGTAAKKATAKTSTAKRTTAKKAAAKKATAKKATAKKTAAKKATAKKSTAKKTAAKKSTGKTSAAKKTGGS